MRKGKEITFIATISFLLITAMVIGPLDFGSALTKASTQLDTIVWESSGTPDYMDPHVNNEPNGNWIHNNIYETLFTYPWDSADANSSVGLLAESVEISSDGLNYTFTLRQGVTFHDGTPFNASCVVYNIRRVFAIFDTWGPAWKLAEPILGSQAIENAVYEYGEGSPQHIGNYTNWISTFPEAVAELDTYVVQILLAYPYAPYIAALTHQVGSMISPTWIEANGGITFGQHNSYVDNHTCGTGSYILEEWVPDDHITLTKNADYWRHDDAIILYPNAGSIETIIIKINEDVDSRIFNITNGNTDGCYWPTSHAYQIYDNQTGQLKPDYEDILQIWTGGLTFDLCSLGLNMNPYLNQSGLLTESPFTNKDFRESLSYAFNYSAYIESEMSGFGIPLQGPIPEGMSGHDSNLFMYKNNLTNAVEYWNLAMATGLDDVWANHSYSFCFYYNTGNAQHEEACQLLKDGIDAIIAHPSSINPSSSLTVNVVGLNDWSFMYQVRNRQLPVYFYNPTAYYSDPHIYIGRYVRTTGTYPLRIGLGNSLGWDSGTVDGWIVEAYLTLNTSRRIELYELIQEEIVDHAAYIWVSQATDFHVEYENVRGYVFNPMRDPYFYHYWKEGTPTTTTTTTTTSTTTTTGTTSTSTTTGTTSSTTRPNGWVIPESVLFIGFGVTTLIIGVLIGVLVTRRRE
ncbi:MAG: ABC transporter substrate-binding protein [Candidatus Thorarchaeota archaeon]